MNDALTSGRHVGAKAQTGPDKSFRDKMRLIVTNLRVQKVQGATAESEVAARLKDSSFGVHFYRQIEDNWLS